MTTLKSVKVYMTLLNNIPGKVLNILLVWVFTNIVCLLLMVSSVMLTTMDTLQQSVVALLTLYVSSIVSSLIYLLYVYLVVKNSVVCLKPNPTITNNLVQTSVRLKTDANTTSSGNMTQNTSRNS